MFYYVTIRFDLVDGMQFSFRVLPADSDSDLLARFLGGLHGV